MSLSDFSLGFMDGITVTSSISSGLFATDTSKETILKMIVTQSAAGATSMALSNYIATDDTKRGMTTFVGYVIGSLISYVSFYVSPEIERGFKYSVVGNLIALAIFGYIRAHSSIKEEDDTKKKGTLMSIVQVLTIGIISMFLTYFISKKLQ